MSRMMTRIPRSAAQASAAAMRAVPIPASRASSRTAIPISAVGTGAIIEPAVGGDRTAIDTEPTTRPPTAAAR